MPAATQASSNQPLLPTSRAISPATMKIPDPIIEPATIMVESKSPSVRLSSRGGQTLWESSPLFLAKLASSDWSNRYHRPRWRPRRNVCVQDILEILSPVLDGVPEVSRSGVQGSMEA